jgi:hypothetical protein
VSSPVPDRKEHRQVSGGLMDGQVLTLYNDLLAQALMDPGWTWHNGCGRPTWEKPQYPSWTQRKGRGRPDIIGSFVSFVAVK